MPARLRTGDNNSNNSAMTSLEDTEALNLDGNGGNPTDSAAAACSRRERGEKLREYGGGGNSLVLELGRSI